MHELGLKDSVIAVDSKHDAVSKRYIFVGNKLHLLPSGFLAMLRPTSPFSNSLLWMILREWWMHRRNKPSNSDDDESVYQFFQRRFNTEVSDFFHCRILRYDLNYDYFTSECHFRRIRILN